MHKIEKQENQLNPTSNNTAKKKEKSEMAFPVFSFPNNGKTSDDDIEMTIYTYRLLSKAYQRHGAHIAKCSNTSMWRQCLQVYNGKAMLYYNTTDQSTRIASMKIPGRN